MRWVLWLTRALRRFGGSFFEEALLRRRAAQAADPEALAQLAKTALERGDAEEAEHLARQGLALEPCAEIQARLQVTLAAIARSREAFAEAQSHLDAALAAVPDYPPALTNRAELLLVVGRADAALSLLEQALKQAPQLLPARINRIAAWIELGRLEQAEKESQRLLARHPEDAAVLINHANVLLQRGKGRQAVRHLRRALEIAPQRVEARFLLGALVGDGFELRAAIEYLEKRLARRGDSRELLAVLANAHQAAGNLNRAAELAKRLLALDPRHVAARLVLGSIASSSGHSDVAERLYEALFEDAGELWGVGSNWLFEGNYNPHLPPAELYDRHVRWAQRYAAPRHPGAPPHAPALLPSRTPDRPLRVGYVSGDLCQHPVGALIYEVLTRHRRDVVEAVAFSTTLRKDDLTAAIAPHCVAWHDVFDFTDDELETLIRDERIDVLVDLAGHTAFHRLPVFARRPAPVQVTWLGYFHSTGVAAIDYLLTDPGTSPRELGQHFAETPIYLGSSRFCFLPPPYAPPVAPAPSERGAPFTFGCFNRLAKLNDEVIAAWARILHLAPHARLWLKAGALRDAWVRADLSARFAAQGIAPHRLVLSPGGAHQDMLAEFAQIDLALDPFPFTGGATTFEGLWMGVPCLTVPGATMVSRQTHAMNLNLGLAMLFSASGIRDYIARAVAFAQHPEPLWALRRALRPRVAASPLCDGEGYCRRVERFYRLAFEAACRGEKLAPYTLIQA